MTQRPDLTNEVFELGGVNHVALVCSDMARTVDFYSGVLGMPLIKTVELRDGLGQHFFFDIGNGDSLAFFWFANGAEGIPGVSHPAALPGRGSLTSGVGSMNHLAFSVPAERIDGYVEVLRARGVECLDVANHDDSGTGITPEFHPGVFVRSIYFRDPDGIMLEFAAWTKPFGPDDVRHPPVDATGTPRT